MTDSQEKTKSNLLTTERQKKKEIKLFRTLLLLDILFLSVEICVGFIYLPQKNVSPITTEFPTTSPSNEPTTIPSLSRTQFPTPEFSLSTNELEKLCDLCFCVGYFSFNETTNTYSAFDLTVNELFIGFSTELLRSILENEFCCAPDEVLQEIFVKVVIISKKDNKLLQF
eukprot:snap_masked-scaffold_8-processed-gene-14.44-mRNA-1 protein AED:1.00 eAED:1.00 QI:0/0/0/0/1/1/2/0/169